MNDLMIHSYQFIRLYVLKCYNNNQPLPEINERFILYCIKTLGVRSNQGAKSKDTDLLETLQEFYNKEYQPLLNHEKTKLKNTTFLLPYLATRDANSAINIMNLTKCWIEKQERPACFQISSFTSSNNQKEEEKVRPS